MTSKWKYAIAAGVLAAAFWTIPGVAQDKKTDKAPAGGRIEKVMVHGKSLEGNLQGDPPERDVAIYLPPSYGRETSATRWSICFTATDAPPTIGIRSSASLVRWTATSRRERPRR